MFSRIFFSACFIIITIVSDGNISYIESFSNDLPMKQKRFINELFIQGRYFDALTETRRLLALYPKIADYKKYHYFIEGNYFLGKQYKTVISHLNQTMDFNYLKIPYAILLSQSYLKIGLYNEGLNALMLVNYDDINIKSRNDLLLRRIEIFIIKSEYNNAIAEIEKVKDYLFEYGNLELMVSDIMRYQEIRLKSKWLALSFSIFLPGAGQIYSNRFLDGMISFLSIAATSYGSYFFHKKGQNSLSMALFAFTSLFYVGNIYGAYNSLERYNIEANNSFKFDLLKKYIPSYFPMDYIKYETILR